MHPKVKAFYAQNTDLEYLKTVQDRLEEQFTEAVSTEPKLTVERIYRVKLGGFKANEHVWYEQRETGKDNAGNEIVFHRTIGKYDMPTAQYRFDGANKKQLTGISDVRTEYDIAWSPKIIEEFEEKGMINERTQCYVQSISRVYGPFYIETFKISEFEDLAYAGITPEQKQLLTGKKASSK